MTTAPPDQLLGLLGLGLRARRVILGVDRVREAVRANRVACLVLASDASARAREKVVRLAAARGVPILPGPTAEAIGARLGKPGIMVAAVLDRALARGLAAAGPGQRASREA